MMMRDDDANKCKGDKEYGTSISPEIFVIKTPKNLPRNPVVIIRIDSVTALFTNNSIHFS